MEGLAVTYSLNLLYQCALLALVALGLAIVFGQLGIMNMAHGEFLMLGAYAMVVVQRVGLPLWLGGLYLHGAPLALAISAELPEPAV